MFYPVDFCTRLHYIAYMPNAQTPAQPASAALTAAAYAIDARLCAAERDPNASAERIARLNDDSRRAWCAVVAAERAERAAALVPVHYDEDGMALADDVVQAQQVAEIHREAADAHYDALVLQMQVRRDYMRGAAA